MGCIFGVSGLKIQQISHRFQGSSTPPETCRRALPTAGSHSQYSWTSRTGSAPVPVSARPGRGASYRWWTGCPPGSAPGRRWTGPSCRTDPSRSGSWRRAAWRACTAGHPGRTARSTAWHVRGSFLWRGREGGGLWVKWGLELLHDGWRGTLTQDTLQIADAGNVQQQQTDLKIVLSAEGELRQVDVEVEG